jgi:hypothetical protein
MSAASDDRGDRVSLTLVISSLSAGAAAIVVPLIWENGTLLATAITPVIVALVSEALRRPAERLGEVLPEVARRTATRAVPRHTDDAAAQLPAGGGQSTAGRRPQAATAEAHADHRTAGVRDRRRGADRVRALAVRRFGDRRRRDDALRRREDRSAPAAQAGRDAAVASEAGRDSDRDARGDADARRARDSRSHPDASSVPASTHRARALALCAPWDSPIGGVAKHDGADPGTSTIAPLYSRCRGSLLDRDLASARRRQRPARAAAPPARG